MDSEDLTQETFLKAVKNIDQFNESSSLYTWLFRIARNTCIDAMRKLRTRRRYSAEHEQLENHADPLQNDVVFDQIESGRMLRAILSGMPEEYRELIMMKDMEGMKYHEIAEITRVQEGTIKSRLFRARLMLKKRLTQAGYEHDA